MIASIAGKVTEVLSTAVVLELGGVGYEVRVTSEELIRIRVGQVIKLYIHEHIREDLHDLYGFAEPAAKTLFEQLIGVSGVGPKVAMAILSAATVDHVRTAIAADDVGVFEAVAGVGKRTAGRIILELRNKVVGESQAAAERWKEDPVYEALRKFGYAPPAAKEAVKAIPEELKTDAERIKFALKSLSRQ
ncbi:Holliday junction branch migration protein RuvA [Candidatus Microgenomates bacterium]|nr:Holliday junction branch migration protein RuvA [Candidatus Microgenomates bacterium]